MELDEVDVVGLSALAWMKWCEAQPSIGGSSRIVAIRQPGELRPTDLQSVVGLCGLCRFECHSDLPGVRSLSLAVNGLVDEPTARSFSGLRALRVETRRPVSLRWFEAAPLFQLAFRDRSVTEHEYLKRSNIRELRLEWTGLPLDDVPRAVRRLVINAWRPLPMSRLSVLRDLPCLEKIALSGRAELKDMRSLAQMRSLVAVSAPVRSLEGIDAVPNLNSLRLVVHAPSVAPLAGAGGLHTLEIRGKRAPSDIGRLSAVPSLRRLILDLGDVNGLAEIGSIGFLGELPALEEVTIHGVKLLDGSLDVLRRRQFRKIDLRGDFGPGASSFAAAVPSATVKFVTSDGQIGLDDIALIEGLWVLFADLAADLGYDNNFGVERAVKQVLQTTAPGTLSRVQFDTETEAFCVRAEAREDVDALVAVLRSLRRAKQ